MTENTRAIVEAIARRNYGKLLAVLIHRFADFELCEEALQDAIIIAMERWPKLGVPPNPVAWLMLTAKRKAIDQLRRNQRIQSIRAEWLPTQNNSQQEPDIDDMQIPDERLRLIFTCCHPSLDPQIRIALTLKTLCGFDMPQLSSTFVTSESTMAQRLVRAKRKIKLAGIPFEVPSSRHLPERLKDVLSVVYFIFNEGYSSSHGDSLINEDYCNEAIHLCRTLLQLMPTETEIMGLLALMLFHQSRYPARVDKSGGLIALEHQDRELWDRNKIEVADRILKPALMMGRPGPYQIQAAISAVHSHAPTFTDTDWKQIVLLYRKLMQHDNNQVIRVNLAVALSFAENPQSGLDYLASMDDEASLQNYYSFHVAKADIYRRLGDTSKSTAAYREAIQLCNNQVEKNYLISRLNVL